MTDPNPALFQALSTLLSDVPKDELCLVLSSYTSAILNGDVQSLPINAPPFSVTLLNESGKSETRTIPEELVLTNAPFIHWIMERRTASRLHLMAHTGQVRLFRESLESGEADFHAMLEQRKTFLKKQLETPAPRPAPKAKVQPNAKANVSSGKAKAVTPAVVKSVPHPAEQ